MRFKILGLVGVLAIPSSLAAQNWTAAEKEVLKALEDCNQAYVDQNVQVAEACTHADFVGWRYDMPGTRGKAVIQREDAYSRTQGGQNVSWVIEPLSVRIYGNVAIVHYFYYEVAKDSEGKTKTEHGRWTDVLVKQGDRWLLLGDHGGAAED